MKVLSNSFTKSIFWIADTSIETRPPSVTFGYYTPPPNRERPPMPPYDSFPETDLPGNTPEIRRSHQDGLRSLVVSLVKLSEDVERSNP